VLGPLLEVNLRQGLVISNGNWLVLVQSPIALVLYGLGAASVIGPWLLSRRRRADYENVSVAVEART